jgi:ADP-heptose:LPS heptosyltransferase
MTLDHPNAAALAAEAARRLAELRSRREAGTFTADEAARLARGAAADYRHYHLLTQSYLREAVTLLCELTALKERQLAQAGLEGLFAHLVERLNDAFAPDYCHLYDHAFAQVIDFYRRQPAGRALDAGLRRFGLHSEPDLLRRKAGLRRPRQSHLRELRAIKKVLLLSRVTLGADVAVTSVILRRLQQALPGAELVLLGSRKLRQLFGGEPRVRVRELHYERGGDLLTRLESWLAVAAAVEDEQRGLAAEKILVLDPDSRLTQLGLLPVLADERNYWFFESRSYRRAGVTQLGSLAAHWLNEILREDSQAFPFVALLPEHQRFGQDLGRKLRRGGAAYLVSVSLGAGGNPRKQLSASFEEELMRALAADAALILDKGASAEERQQVNRLVAALKSEGKTIIELDEGGAVEAQRAEALRADVLTWDGGIGVFAALTAASDEYLGYDSAGQHIAAALGIPTLTIFAQAESPLFAERWRPYGPGIIEVVTFDPALTSEADSSSRILTEVLTRHHKLRNR